MKQMKTLLKVGLIAALLSTGAYAKKSEEEKKQKKNSSQYSSSKPKELPRGLQKKLQRDKQLPAGWQKKLIVGQPLDPLLIEEAIIVSKPRYYNKDIEKSPRETIYQIEDKLIKVMTATNIIMDIFEIE